MTVRPYISMTQVSGYGAVGNAIGIRPVFWLDRDFFCDVKLDLSKTGSGVSETFKKYYPIDKLCELYTDQEGYDYFGYKCPIGLVLQDNGLITVSNTRPDAAYGLLITVYFDEAGYPIRQTYQPIKLDPLEESSVAADVRFTDEAYATVKMIERTKYHTISNSLRIDNEGRE